MKIENLSLAGLKLIHRQPISDQRGYLQRMYCQEMLAAHGVTEVLSQINLTLTRVCGTVRGMHYQHPPYAEIKIVNCLRGRIFDVAIDLRKNSPTFLQWHAEILSAELNNSLLIPKGFAHGFQTLTSDCELLYFHTAAYQAKAEEGILPQDPLINIAWPLEIKELSDRDRRHPLLSSAFEGLTYEL